MDSEWVTANPEKGFEVTEYQRWVQEHYNLPKCARCKTPTPDEYVDPHFWEAGERVCDDCRNVPRLGTRGKRGRRVAT